MGQANFTFFSFLSSFIIHHSTLPIDDKGFQVSCLEGKKRRNEEEKKRGKNRDD